MSLKVALALLAIFVANYNNVRDSAEEEDRKVVIKKEYDFVVVGAGNTGSVVAARLAQLGQSVLVIEAGQSGRNEVNIDVPFNSMKLLGSERDWNFKMIPQKKLSHDREISINRGKVGGGSSAFHFNNYIRGSEHDYRLWEDEGATGWNLQNLKKYFAKVEKATEDGMSDSLGRDGSVRLSKRFEIPLQRLVKNAANEIGLENFDCVDWSGPREGVSNITSSVFNGRRQYALNCYLYPEMSKENSTIDVAFGAHANKILFREIDGEIEAYALHFNHTGVIKTVRFRKEIIISAGVLNTPKLLMLSGIGPRRHLRKIGVDLVANVPGVGSASESHFGIHAQFYGNNIAPGESGLPIGQILETFPNYEANGTGPMTSTALDSNYLFFRSKFVGSEEYGPEKYQYPDIVIQASGLSLNVDNFPDFNKIYGKTYENARMNQNGTLLHFGFLSYIAHSFSKGTVRLRSNDPNDPPIFDAKMFKKRIDYKILKEAMRKLELLENTNEFKQYGLKLTMVPDSCLHLFREVPRSAEFYKCYIKEVATVIHITSTCKMGFRNKTMSVVDDRLRIHAVNKVRIADASIFPHITSANPHSTCYVVGEKAADMIVQDWGL